MKPIHASVGRRALTAAVRYCVAVAALVAASPPSLRAAALEYGVSTTKAQVRPGEALDYLVTARNPESSPVTLRFPTAAQAEVSLDGGIFRANGATLAETYVTVPAHGEHTWRFSHIWHYAQPGHGRHEVVGRVIRHSDLVGPASFEVVPAVYPTENFLIDFDTVPGTTERIQTLMELWPSGVRFGSRRDPSTPSWLNTDPRIHGRVNGIGGVVNATDPSVAGNQWVGVNVSRTPPGMNFVAEFEMPVYGVSVDVSPSPGGTITMVAKGADDRVLAAVTSGTVSEFLQFTGPLTLRADRPIASLEWWPSALEGSVRIDNLSLELRAVPEPAAAAALALTAALLLIPRRRPTGG